MNIVRVNQKNQINIPKEVAESINFGPDRYVQMIADPNNVIRLIPVVPEPLYSRQALEGLERLVEREKDKAKEVRGKRQEGRRKPSSHLKIFKKLHRTNLRSVRTFENGSL